MFDALIFAAALTARVSAADVIAVALVVVLPLPLVLAAALVLLLSAFWRREPATGADWERVFLEGMVAELRGGATVRTAIGAAAHRVPELTASGWVRGAVAGRPLSEVALGMRREMVISGRAAAAALTFAADSGGASVGVFTSLAQQTDDVIELDRERRVASAQARLSAMVVSGAPLPILVWLASRGTLAELVGSAPGRLVLGAGIALEVAGIALTVLQLRRPRR